MDLAQLKSFLPRILLALGIYIAVLAGFIELLDEVEEGSTLVLDEAALRSIYQTATPFWDSLYLFVTSLGSVAFITVVVLALSGFFLTKKLYQETIFLVATTAGAGLINTGMKLIVGRSRPVLWEQLITESSYAFPSGHAIGSSALAISIVYILWNTRWRIPVAVVGVIYVLLVGYSRLYLGVHYPSDIVGGWLLGIAWALTVAAILRGYSWRRIRRMSKTDESKKRTKG